MADGVILLGFEYSIFSMRARVALSEKGVEYEYREEDLGNKSPLLVKMNPIQKKIPVLIHNGKPICESLIILEYVDEVWKDNSPLMPSDPYQRAQAKFWADTFDKKVYPLMKNLWTTEAQELLIGKKEFIDILKLYEGQLGDKPYFGGDHFGFLDVALAPYYTWFYAYEQLSNFSFEEHCPKLVAWAKRCMEKECASKSLPNPKKVYEFILHIRKFGFP